MSGNEMQRWDGTWPCPVTGEHGIPVVGIPTDKPRLDDWAYDLINQKLHAECGLHFPPHRRRVLESRVRPRLETLGLETFEQYASLIRRDPSEVVALVSFVTNNETYLFRERRQFEALFASGANPLPRNRTGPARVLCAGCASGDEAFTIAFYARDYLSEGGVALCAIDAFDIDKPRLAVADTGRLLSNALRETSDAERARYLTPNRDGTWTVRPEFRRIVRFSYGNIVELPSFRSATPYDVVFCRNVLIYFSEMSMRRALKNFAKVLRPGGLLFLGHAEAAVDMPDEFETARLGNVYAYRKVAG